MRKADGELKDVVRFCPVARYLTACNGWVPAVIVLKNGNPIKLVSASRPRLTMLEAEALAERAANDVARDIAEEFSGSTLFVVSAPPGVVEGTRLLQVQV